MATTRELAAAYFAAEDKLGGIQVNLARLRALKQDTEAQVTAAQAERGQAQTELAAAKAALKAAL